MIKLLRRWAELEPDQCKQIGFNAFTVAGRRVSADSSYSKSDYIQEPEIVLAWLGYAAQEAIKARRGWSFDLSYGSYGYRAIVNYGFGDVGTGESDSGCLALLLAYVNAIEAQRINL